MDRGAGAIDRNLRKGLVSRMRRLLLTGGRSAYPNLKKAQAEGRVILYIDEAAATADRLLPATITGAHVGTLWQTPILVEQTGRAHLSLIAAIAPNGRLYLAGQDQPFSSEDIVWFLDKLCSRYRKRDLLVIWDGAAIHRSQVVKDLLSRKPGRVHLERLPAYSPDRTADAAKPCGTTLERSKTKFEESGFYYTEAPPRGSP